MSTSSSATYEQVSVTVADVEGWMTPDQARRLWDCARGVTRGGQIVEIGSFRGRSMIVLASAADPDVRLIAIDPHAGNDRGPQEFEGYGEQASADIEVFRANLAAAGVADRVEHLRKFSSDALGDVSEPIDLLYIDGAHRLRPALNDIRSWSAKIRPGGDLLIHDCFSSVGVTGALVATLFFSSEFRYLGRSQSMTHYRHEPLTTRDRVGNAARQVAQLPWFVRNVIIKALILAKLGPVTRLMGHDPDTWPH